MGSGTAQTAALIGHLNALRRGIATRHFFPDNSTCADCESVQFLRPKHGSFSVDDEWEIVARTPDEWLDAIVARGLARAVLVHAANADTTLCVRRPKLLRGGGCRLLCVERSGYSEYWDSHWKVVRAGDRRVWKVRYSLVAEGPTGPRSPVSVNEMSLQLGTVLPEIEAFARAHDREYFAECFARARHCLTVDEPLARLRHPDLAPEAVLSPPAGRLLAACDEAWVFGGMGSWNDDRFEGEAQALYDRLTKRLQKLLIEAICAGVNDTATGTELSGPVTTGD